MLPEFADKIQVFAGDVVAAKKPDPATRLQVDNVDHVDNSDSQT